MMITQNPTKTVLTLTVVAMAILAASANAGVIFTESFESPDVLDNVSADPTGWATTGHPNYIHLADENDTPSLFTTPDGAQGAGCYSKDLATGWSYATTTSSILSDTVALEMAYTVSFNVSKVSGSKGEYRVELLAIDDSGPVETVLGFITGDNDGSNDMSYSDSFSVTPTGNAGQRLAIRIGMDPVYDDWHNKCIFDNVQLDVGSADPNSPDVDPGVDMITWSGQAVTLAPDVTNNDPNGADLTYLWSAENPDPNITIVFAPAVNPADPNTSNVEAPTVTITKATDNPSVVTLTLAVNNVGRLEPPVEETMTIDVYDNACEAAKGVGPVAFDTGDLDENCITNLKDFAVLAAAWFDDYTITVPVVK